MPTEVLMPQLGMGMEEGTITSWLKKEGDRVEKGQPLFTIASDKVEAEIEAPASGILARILHRQGVAVPVSMAVAFIATAGEATPAEPPGPAPATPVARRLAREHGVDLTAVPGTGPGGRITREDVERTLVARATRQAEIRESVEGEPAAGAASEPATGHQAPATEAWEPETGNQAPETRDVAPVTLTTEADAGELVRLREQLTANGRAMSDDAFWARIIALAMREHDHLNLPWTVTNLGRYEVDAFTPLLTVPYRVSFGVGRIIPKPVIRDGTIAAGHRVMLCLTVDERFVDGGAAARLLQRIREIVQQPSALFTASSG